MPNISQVKIDNTTYDLIDAETKIKFNKLQDYFSIGAVQTPDQVPTIYSPDHGRFTIDKSIAMHTGGCQRGDPPIYSMYIWSGTGNIRADKYDPSTGTNLTRGYFPLSKNVTKKCVSYVSNTSLITPSSGITINTCVLTTWGQVCSMILAFKYSSAISVPISGNITNVTVGTLDAKYRPSIEVGLRSNANSTAGAAWGYLKTDGSIVLGALDGWGTAARSLAANTVINLGGTWIMTMDNNF